MNKLVDMARPKEKDRNTKAVQVDSEGNRYPWGLSLTLENESLKKLGLTGDDFEADGMVTLICKARCTSKTERSEKGKDEASVSLQIEKMTVETQEDKADAAFEKRFGNGR